MNSVAGNGAWRGGAGSKRASAAICFAGRVLVGRASAGPPRRRPLSADPWHAGGSSHAPRGSLGDDWLVYLKRGKVSPRAQVCVRAKNDRRNTASPFPASVRAALKYLFNERLKVFKCSSFILLEIIYLAAWEVLLSARQRSHGEQGSFSRTLAPFPYNNIHVRERWSERGTPFAAAEMRAGRYQTDLRDYWAFHTASRPERDAKCNLCEHIILLINPLLIWKKK